jgi:carboxymethylenebutenolidase
MGDMVSFPSNGGTGAGYLAAPHTGTAATRGAGDAGATDATGAAVIVIQEWWGLVPHIKELADRFAEAGFVALAPDLYHGAVAAEPDEAAKLAMGLRMDQAATDIAGAAAYLAGRADVTAGVGCVGFCLGGSLALWSATLSGDITATVGFYPAIPWERMSPRWSNYAGKAAVIHCSEGDGTSAAPGIQLAHKAIEEAGGEVTVHDYPGTHHAFFNDDRPEVYSADAARVAWARTLEFFRNRLT